MNRIRDLREDRDLRQIDVAAATGIDQKTLSNYETGKTNPNSVAIVKLAQFFSVTADYILGLEEVNLRNKSDVARELDAIGGAARLYKKAAAVTRRIKTAPALCRGCFRQSSSMSISLDARTPSAFAIVKSALTDGQ